MEKGSRHVELNLGKLLRNGLGGLKVHSKASAETNPTARFRSVRKFKKYQT
jgi:hypothetical protein